MLRRPILPFAILAFASVASTAQQAVQQSKTDPVTKKVLTLADYGRWSRITAAALSPDGKWMTYALTPNDGDPTLYVKELDGSRVYTIRNGLGAQFSDDSRWVAYFGSPATATGRSGRGNAPPPTPPPTPTPSAPPGTGRGSPPESSANRTFELLDLTTGARTSMPGIGSFRFANGSRWLALRANKPAGQTTSGVTVVVEDLTTGAVAQTFGNVGESEFDDAATLFAYTVDANDKMGNGIYLYDMERSTTAPLITGSFDFDHIAWRARSTDLIALRGDKKKGFIQRDNALVLFTKLSDPGARRATVIDSVTPGVKSPAMNGMVISELAAPRWSRDGSRIFLGVKEQEPEAPVSSEPKANVDVWHWKDDNVQSVQIVQLAQTRRATTSASYDVKAGRFVVLGDSAMRVVTPTPNSKWGVGHVDTTYGGAVQWGGSRGDYYRVDLATATRTLIESGLVRTMGVSPDSKWYLFLKGKQLRAYNVESGTTTTLSVPGVSFLDETDDYPYEKPIYGVAGWSKDGRVILDHRFDLWAVPLDGSKATNLTSGVGAAEQIRFRLLTFGGGRGGRGGGGAGLVADTSDDPGIDLTKPLTLTAYGEWTKKSGYYQVAPGSKPRPLLFADKNIGSATKASKAGRMLFTEQTAAEFPDYWVSDSTFGSPNRVTDANPFIGEYDWTPGRVLIDYKNSKGEKLQGTLTLPATYQSGKKYPMLVYFYDRMSNTHHVFSMPVYDDRPHMSTYASDGYLVLQPDIVYETGKPGTSALDCITSAVKRVIDLGYADPKHIGLQGHSWGGYQSSFILTQTDMFAAVVTGAPPTDLASFYDETYPGTGTLQQGIMEVGQVRMGEGNTPWTAREMYDAQANPITSRRRRIRRTSNFA